MSPVHVLLWAAYGLASAAPEALQRWSQHRRERADARAVLEVKLLRRLADATEGTYADVYELATVDNYTTAEINAALDRLRRRNLVTHHPDGGWVPTMDGLVRARGVSVADLTGGG